MGVPARRFVEDKCFAHAFKNGNKRAAFAASSAFLRLNGFQFTFTQGEAVEVTLRVLNHKIDRDQLADLINGAMSANV